MRTLARQSRRTYFDRVLIPILFSALSLSLFSGLARGGTPPPQVAANPLLPPSPSLPGTASPSPGVTASPGLPGTASPSSGGTASPGLPGSGSPSSGVTASPGLPGSGSPSSGGTSSSPPGDSFPCPVEIEYFKHGKRITIRSENAEKTFLLYVAQRVFPHPSETTWALRVIEKNEVRSAVDRMAQKPVPGLSIRKSIRHGQSVAVVTIDRASLNRLANTLAVLVKTSYGESMIRSVRFSGPPRKDQAFLAKNLCASPGDPVSNGALAENVYVISQLPGYARADALLVPTGEPGSDDIVVRTFQSPPLAGSQIEMDNYGYAPTGAVTLNGTLDLSDGLFTGDQLSALASTSFFGMNSGTLAYSAPVDLFNRLGIDMNALDYRLGLGFSPWGHGATVGQLVALGLSGSNYSFDGWGMHSLVKTNTSQAFLKATLFLKEFQDTYSSTVQNDRSILGGTLELSGSTTRGSLAASFDLADTEYDLSEGSGSSPQNPFYSDTQGVQNYWTENGGIRVALSPVYAVYLSTVDQQYIGGGVLDPMLQGVLGGMSNVRVLPTAALFGNNLYSGSLNLLRSDTVRGGSLVSSAFFDVGQVTGIGTQYSAMGPGVEESWTGAHLFGKADLAVPVGPLPVSALGSQMVALTGGNIQSGGIPLQLWLSLGWRY